MEEPRAFGQYVEITYKIWLPDNSKMEFPVKLDRESLRMKAVAGPELPDWTMLEFHMCPNCTLDPVDEPRCPAAAGTAAIVEFFRVVPSYEEVDVSVVCPERKYVKRTQVQYVAGSLMWLCMATGGCPVLGRFRPLVRSHLPFATLEENSARLISMYLLEQHALYTNGGAPDWRLEGLAHMLAEAETVFDSFCKRLGAVRSEGGDACLNAVNILNNMNVLTRMSIEDGARGAKGPAGKDGTQPARR